MNITRANKYGVGDSLGDEGDGDFIKDQQVEKDVLYPSKFMGQSTFPPDGREVRISPLEISQQQIRANREGAVDEQVRDQVETQM